MNLLLDTHVLIWWLEGSGRLGRRTRQAICTAGSSSFISVVSAWEINIKTAVNRLTMNANPEEAVPGLFADGFEPLPIHFRHAFAVRSLPLHHSDPFDRMLIAQAQCERLTLVTADTAFGAYGIPTLDATT